MYSAKYNLQHITCRVWNGVRQTKLVMCLMAGIGNYKIVPIRMIALTLLVLMIILVITRPSSRLIEEDFTIHEKPRTDHIRRELFPKIIHQVWVGYGASNPPEAWQNATMVSRNNNPDYTYMLWLDGDVIQLLEEHYAWFLPTYRSYPYNIERADAARYFIIRHYGGVYLDMDEVSVVPITDIIQNKTLGHYDCVIPEGTPIGVTNYVIICKKQSPFMRFLTSKLIQKSGWYGIPYATVMWSTGPRFMSGVYDQYSNKDSLYIMPGDDVRQNFVCLFGQSWFSIDGVLLHIIVYPFIRMGIPWYYLIILIIVIIAVLLVKCCKKQIGAKGDCAVPIASCNGNNPTLL